MKWLKLFLSVIKKTKIVVCGLLLIMIGYCVSAQNSPGKTNENTPSAVIHADKTGTPIHPYLYGMFTELLSNMFENGLWSEMLSDRKFFYPVDNSATLVPKNGKGHQNRWRPIGPENVVTLDSANIYVGKHSPKVLLDGNNQNGIKQAGLWLTNGKKYMGRIVLAANPGVTVEVSLVWGSAPTDRQKITISNLSSGFKTYPLSFTSKAENKNCSLEIVGKGKGAFNIGAVSLMPADNLYGFRKDIIDVLKEIHSGPYRWPGGNFVSNYDWRNGIGNPDKRPPRYDFAWNTVESNDVGTDEYLNLCKIAGVDPYICVNAGMGDEYSAAQWVEYVNGKQTTTMGKLRAANGHPEPYNVKNWGVGNEAYGGWQLGHMSSEQFVMKHNFFAEAMHKVDPSIKLIASGASLFESNVSSRLNRQPLQSKVPYAYMSVDDWDGILFKGAYQNMDYVSEHLYPVFNSAYDVQQQKFVTNTDSLIDRIRILSNRVEAMTEAMKEYEKRIPGLKEKNIKFWVDEWTAGRGGFEATLCMVEALQEMIRHTDYIMMGGFTSVGSLYVKNDVAASISSKGLIFKMFHDRFGTIPVEVTGNSPQHEIKGVYLVDKPATPSGSATYPLDVVAALNAGKTKLTISVVNATYSEQNLNLNFEGIKVNTNAKTWVMKVPVLNIENKVGEAPVVSFVESQTQLNSTVKVPPLSISLFELEKSN